MFARRIAAVGCASLGVYLLAGAGWALLVLAALLLTAGWLDRALAQTPDRIRGGLRYTREAPRRTAAATAMTVGLVAVPTGVALIASGGAALAVLGGLALGVSLLTGWNA